MRFFKLPDLGEGLQEAEIVEWHQHAGASVEVDQLLVSVETAKAIVDIPSPQTGVIAQCFGAPGDLLHIGDSLIEYANEADTATVVGDISNPKESDTEDEEDFFIVGAAPENPAPQTRRSTATHARESLGKTTTDQTRQGTPLKGTRRAMAKAMSHSHQQVAGVTLCEDADIDAWPAHTDTSVRLCRAIASAVQREPLFNAWFDSEHMTLNPQQEIHLGIAVDTADGLFVPVLHNITQRSAEDLREGIDRLREDVEARRIPPREMQGATITLSNFGSLTKTAAPTPGSSSAHQSPIKTLAGRYASPIVVPPCVAIIGAGGARPTPVAQIHSDGYKVVVHRLLPLSLTFDHRVLTGGEAERFLAACIEDLQSAD